MTKNPLVSIVMATYNRAKTIERAIDGVFKQSYSNWELIIVDDGSSDNTSEILDKYTDSRIRRFKHEKNKGVTATKNLGLKNIKGEWFTTFDSDDEMYPEALEVMLNIPLNVDPEVTAVTCNCLDTTTKTFSGLGLKENGYLDNHTLMTVCKHEFWGITRSDLLQNDLFNENLFGYESILWYKIDDRAKRYYIHRALRIYHTEGSDSVTKAQQKYNFEREISHYSNIIVETHYLEKVKKYNPNEYYHLCKEGLIVTSAINNKEIAEKYLTFIKDLEPKNHLLPYIYKFRILAISLIKYKKFKKFIKNRFLK